MNPNFGYQLYQAQRQMTRQEIIAADVLRGQQAAAVSRACRGVAHRARRSGTIVIGAIAPLASRALNVQAEET